MPSMRWCLRKILQIPYTRHTTNDTVRSITGCSPVSERVKSFQLRFFGHLARSAPEEDHHRVIAARCGHLGGDLLVVQDPPG